MKWALLVLVLLAVPASPSHAAEPYAVMGLGAGSCGKFAEMSRLDPSQAELDYLSWAQGFMSGLNMQKIISNVHSITKNLNGISIESQKWMLRKYCNDHPLGEVETAVMQLYFSLPDNSPQ